MLSKQPVPVCHARAEPALAEAGAGIQPGRYRRASEILDSRPSLLSAGVTFFRGNDGIPARFAVKTRHRNYKWQQLRRISLLPQELPHVMR